MSSSKSQQQKLRLIFVGTGGSTGIPMIGHFSNDCACGDALASPNSPNRRNNVSMLIQEWCDELPSPKPSSTSSTPKAEGQEEGGEDKQQQKKKPSSGWGKNILIDVGKTFREAYLRTLAPLRISQIDAIVLTHEHSDAAGGLDDVRDVQSFESVGPHFNVLEAIPLFASPYCLSSLRKSISYVINNSRVQNGFYSRAIKGFEEDHPFVSAPGDEKKKEELLALEKSEGLLVPHGGNTHESAAVPAAWEPRVIPRRTSALDVFLLDENRGPFEFTVTPAGHRGKWFGVPMEHGAGYTCLGFVFGETPSTRVVYLSDVSKISETTMKFLKTSEHVQPFQTLVVDGLLPFGDQTHFSHYTLDQAWELTKELDPKESYCVGMWCKVEHHESVKKMTSLVEEYKQKHSDTTRLEKFTLAHDGLELILE